MPKPKPSPLDNWRGLLTLGTEIVAILGLWLAVGYGLDRYLGWAPFGVLGGGLVGVLHVMVRLFRL